MKLSFYGTERVFVSRCYIAIIVLDIRENAKLYDCFVHSGINLKVFAISFIEPDVPVIERGWVNHETVTRIASGFFAIVNQYHMLVFLFFVCNTQL